MVVVVGDVERGQRVGIICWNNGDLRTRPPSPLYIGQRRRDVDGVRQCHDPLALVRRPAIVGFYHRPSAWVG